MHAGSGNHGCEAIVRSLIDLTGEELTVLSNDVHEDELYSLHGDCHLVQEEKIEINLPAHIWYYAMRKLTGKGEPFLGYRYQNAKPFEAYDLGISIGGDNYCYEMMVKDLILANRMFHGRGLKTVLLGCSIEPELLERTDIREDMKLYDHIIARESITEAALRAAGVTKVSLVPDPAFSMRKEELPLPELWREGHTIGLNVSPMIMDNEDPDRKGITLRNYERLIEHILAATEDVIALIPHVVWERNNDRVPIDLLYEKYKETGRVIRIPDHSAPQIKGFIARCRLFIGARTHATIAAYSTAVPTLVVGYSVKARGIAKDLFGTDEHYVLPVQSLAGEEDLSAAYDWLETHAGEMRSVLETIMPEYIARTGQIKTILSSLVEK